MPIMSLLFSQIFSSATGSGSITRNQVFLPVALLSLTPAITSLSFSHTLTSSFYTYLFSQGAIQIPSFSLQFASLNLSFSSLSRGHSQEEPSCETVKN